MPDSKIFVGIVIEHMLGSEKSLHFMLFGENCFLFTQTNRHGAPVFTTYVRKYCAKMLPSTAKYTNLQVPHAFLRFYSVSSKILKSTTTRYSASVKFCS